MSSLQFQTQTDTSSESLLHLDLLKSSNIDILLTSVRHRRCLASRAIIYSNIPWYHLMILSTARKKHDQI